MSRKRKPNSGNPATPENQRDRMMQRAIDFARDLARIGVPGHYALEYVNTILTTDIPRQCGSCGALHHDLNTLAYYQQAGTNTIVLWARCDACSKVIDKDRLLQIATDQRLEAWANRSVEPEGVVVIFTFAQPKPKVAPIPISELAAGEDD